MRQRNIRRKFLILTVLSLGALLAGAAFGAAPPQNPSPTAQPYGKKLVMKNGSYEIVSSYQREGDRVRFFSVVRAEWEEIPSSMVDWDATRKAAEEQVAAAKALEKQVKQQEIAEEAASIHVDASLEIMPGVFLPPGEGMFILDKRAVFSMSQSQATSKLSKGHLLEQVLVPIPVIPSRHMVELKGAHAKFRISNPAPEFYFRTSDPNEPEIELIEAHVHGHVRRLANIDILFTEQRQKRKSIPLQEWPVANGVYRFTLGQPLKPGEYALAEESAKGGLNFLVWDFGVDKPQARSSGK